MEYTYRFSNGPVIMEKLLEDYYNLDRTRKFCYECPNFNKNWSCPEYDFDEKKLLNSYQYVYLIGKEYHIPREDRQKIIGVSKVGDYAIRAMKILKVSAFKDLIELEKKVPDSMALMPGNCSVCEIRDNLRCTKETTGGPCRHPEVLRFSLESLGLDVDSIMKFEIGIFLQWPKEGHLPEKLCGVMALLTKDAIDMEIIKEHFPDTKKDWRTATLANRDKPEIKRRESWLKKSESANEDETESEKSYKIQPQWIGYKSELLESERSPWKEQQALEEADTQVVTDVRKESEKQVETEGLEAEGQVEIEILTDEQTLEEEKSQMTEKDEKGQESDEKYRVSEDSKNIFVEDEDDKKYKWLGFKRNIVEEDDLLPKWKKN